MGDNRVTICLTAQTGDMPHAPNPSVNRYKRSCHLFIFVYLFYLFYNFRNAIIMVRHYKKQSNEQAWDADNMRQAIEACRAGAMGYSKACQDIPDALLNPPGPNKKHKHCVYRGSLEYAGQHSVFTVEQANELSQYILDMEERLLGLSKADIR